MSLNRVSLVGRLVRDPELRTTSTGKNVAEFTLAVGKRMKPQDGQPDADFLRCKAWSQQAEFLMSYGGKGRLVAVDGRLESRRYVDKDGIQRDAVEVVCDHVALLDRPKDEEPAPTPAAPQKEAPKKELVGAGKGRPKAADYDPFA